MLLNRLLELQHLISSLFLGDLYELAKFDELLFVLRHFADPRLHIIKSLGDVLDACAAPLVHSFNQTLLDRVCLLSEPLLQVLCLDLEDREVNEIVRDVEDFVLMLMELVDLGRNIVVASLDLLAALFCRILKEILNHSLLVDIHNVLVLLVFFE